MSRKPTENKAKERSIAENARINVSDKQEELTGEMLPESDETDETETEAGESKDPLAELYGDMEISLDFKMDKWDLYLFLLNHAYMSLSGFIGIALSLFCLWMAIGEFASGQATSTTWVFLFVGVWFLIINPITMFGKAAMQLKTNATLRKPITYVFTEKGLIQQLEGVKVGCRWEQITKVVKMKRIWVLYTGKMRGNILPVRQFGENREALMELIAGQTGKNRKANR